MARHRFLVDGVEHTVAIDSRDGGFAVSVDDAAATVLDAQVPAVPGLVTTFEAGHPAQAYVARHAQGYDVTVGGRRFEVRTASSSRRGRGVVGGGDDAPGRVSSPLAGVVVAIKVGVGEHVEAGAVLAVVEAMKMQNEVHAPRAGTITAIHLAAGARCERGDLLIEYDLDGG